MKTLPKFKCITVVSRKRTKFLNEIKIKWIVKFFLTATMKDYQNNLPKCLSEHSLPKVHWFTFLACLATPASRFFLLHLNSPTQLVILAQLVITSGQVLVCFTNLTAHYNAKQSTPNIRIHSVFTSKFQKLGGGSHFSIVEQPCNAILHRYPTHTSPAYLFRSSQLIEHLPRGCKHVQISLFCHQCGALSPNQNHFPTTYPLVHHLKGPSSQYAECDRRDPLKPC